MKPGNSIAAPIIFACIFVTACSCTSFATEPTGGNAEKYKEIQAVLEAAIANKEYESEYDDLMRSPYLRDVLVAIAAVDPAKGLSLFADLDNLYRGENKPGFRAMTASALARALTGAERLKLFKACQESNAPEIGQSVALSARVSSPEELTAIAALVDPRTAEGSLALLLAAADLKDSGGDWNKTLQMAQYRNEGREPLAIANKAFRAYLEGDVDSFRKLLGETLSESKTEEQTMITTIGISVPLKLMLMRAVRKTPDHRVRYADYVCEASKSIKDGAAAFTVLAFVAESLGEKPSDCLATQLKERWNDEYLDGAMSAGKHGAAFYAFNAMLGADEQWAITVAEKLVASIMAQESPKNYYHMIGTIAGVVASKDPNRARKIAKQAKMLEWYGNALRCVYREWGKVNPKAALLAVKEEDFWMDDESRHRMCADVTLEAAVGSSLVDPLLAVDEIALLPDNQIRFTQGYCLVAPPLARKDLDRALRLLMPAEGKPMIADAATALAHIVLDHYGIDIDPTVTDFYPDYLRPRNLWPGPHLAQPIRF